MSDENRPKLDLDAVRDRLSQARGREYWRSLNELAGTDEFTRWLDDEFPNRSTLAQIDRRDFLRFMGASLALAGLAGCRSLPQEKIVPYVSAPEEIVPGKPMLYATAVTRSGYASGVLAVSHMGRPTKVEGNPEHPASLGRTDAFMQAAILDLYDPSRAKDLLFRGQVATWDDFVAKARAALRPETAAGFRILTETVTSPTLASQIEALVAKLPGARWHRYDPVHRDDVLAGAEAAFGEPVDTVYHFDKADIVLSLDAEFLTGMPGSVRYAHDFAKKRSVRAGTTTINRLYALESTPTLTGAMADHRLAVRARDVHAIALAVARQLGLVVADGALPESVSEKWVSAVARDLQGAIGRCIVIAGDLQPAAVHVLAHAMNARLGSYRKTVSYVEPIARGTGAHAASISDLAKDIDAGNVRFLLVLGGNPVYSAPTDLNLGGRLRKVPLTAYVGLHDNETAEACQWLVPESHSLEAWSDARAYDGTVSLVQPLIEPLYQTHSAHEVLAALARQPNSGYNIVRQHWQTVRKATGPASPAFERFWRRALHDGVVPGSAARPKAVALRGDLAALTPTRPAEPGLELNIRPDPNVWDGSYADNAWLQELPKPLTKLSWDNAAMLSPRTARRLGVASSDRVELRVGSRSVTAPVWVQPGHPDDAVTVHLGYGRTRSGQVASGAGFNAYVLRTVAEQWTASGLEVRKIPGEYRLVTTQDHHAIDVTEIGRTGGRELVRAGTIAEFQHNPSLSHSEEEDPAHQPTIYPDFEYKDYSWGMVIDLNVCTGCNACVLACQAENNIPVVGKDQVDRGRAMHWIRVDRYYSGAPESPTATSFEPVPCMHCERAPCEPVCPVAATLHSTEGLNQQVYNRCVGTRYCSNNCPYKVRRFNFYKYTAGQPNNAPGSYDIPVMQLSANPNVTVRGRGVMEKCTYCVQRINVARIAAKERGRPIADGEVVTACQQACPTNAIIFGNINDLRSAVAAARKQPHNYGLLEDLNTRPRTTYLAKVRNPNADVGTE